MAIKTKKLSIVWHYLAPICKAEIPYPPLFYMNHKFLITFSLDMVVVGKWNMFFLPFSLFLVFVDSPPILPHYISYHDSLWQRKGIKVWIRLRNHHSSQNIEPRRTFLMVKILKMHQFLLISCTILFCNSLSKGTTKRQV